MLTIKIDLGREKQRQAFNQHLFSLLSLFKSRILSLPRGQRLVGGGYSQYTVLPLCCSFPLPPFPSSCAGVPHGLLSFRKSVLLYGFSMDCSFLWATSTCCAMRSSVVRSVDTFTMVLPGLQGNNCRETPPSPGHQHPVLGATMERLFT